MISNKFYNWSVRSLRLFLCVLAFNACEVIDIAPVDTYTDENFWQTRVQAQAAVIGIYDAFQDLGGEFITWGDARGDLYQSGWGQGQSGIRGQFGQMQRNEVTEDSPITDWGGLYRAINRANVVIANVERVVDADAEFTQREAEYMIGEARYMRALAYFWLVRVWGDAPLLTEPTTADSDMQVGKASQEELLTFIRTELDEIMGDGSIESEMLRREWGNQRQNTSRATMNAGRALLAQVALWQNDYDMVIDQTTDIIDNGGYSLVSGNNWYQNFYPGTTSEIIFQILFDGTTLESNPASPIFWDNTLHPSTYLRELHESTDNPVYQDNVRGNGKTWVWDQARFYKWVGVAPEPTPSPDRTDRAPAGRYTRRRITRDNRDPNIIFFRLADIYLMRAEALNRAGMKEDAIADINTVRDRAALPPAIVVTTRYDLDGPTELTSAASQDQIEDAILEERAMELAGENHRWFDLMRISLRGRTNLLPEYINDPSKYSWNDAFGWMSWGLPPEQRLDKPVSTNPEDWYLPVYLPNRELNPNLGD